MNFSRDSVLGIRDVLCQRDSRSVRASEFDFARGTFHLLRGDAASGHELLFRALGLLDAPEEGDIFIEGVSTRELSDDARLKLRERRLGFVFTAPFLLPAFTVIENIAMPLFKVSEVEPAEARQRSESLLEFTCLGELSEFSCADLSPLQQHRVALARALVNQPAVLLIENLDTALTGEDLRAFVGLLRLAAVRFGIGVLATVSPAFTTTRVDRVIDVVDGLATASEFLPRADA